MKKTFLYSIIILAFLLSGCTTQTPAPQNTLSGNKSEPLLQNSNTAPTLEPEPTIAPEAEPVIEPAQSEQQNCHPSYSGCLKTDASDYDCAGGSGNGPYYTGKVRVTGPDVFDLDRDNDGWGCE
ncbi:MAG: hypothetical protein WC505_04395 [Patescibacteria group bacterium]